MAAFPDLLTSVRTQTPSLEIELQYVTLISNFENSGQLSKRKNLFPKRNVNLIHNNVTKVEGRTLWQFFIERSGMYELFNFFTPFADTYVWEYVGVGDGSTTVFNLPSKLAGNYSLRVGGVDMTITTDYAFSAEGGADGADKITMVVAPNDGAVIIWSFTGRLKIRCRFGEDIASFATFMDRLVSSKLSLKGQLNDA